MRRRKLLPVQLARDLGVSHTTVGRWLSGSRIPDIPSCIKVANYSGIVALRVLAMAGHLNEMVDKEPADWPEFREYARQKYPNELDEDTIMIIEDLIDGRRREKGDREDQKMGI